MKVLISTKRTNLMINNEMLNLDFKGYLEMLKYTKGVAYWQLSVIEPDIRESRIIKKIVINKITKLIITNVYNDKNKK